VKGPQKLFVLVVFAFITIGSSATDIYIAQTAAGANNGADCADAHAVTWFNSSANWGTAAGQIGPGTVVHLCGTISSNLTVQASGAAGNDIEILFEANAMLSQPACNPSCLNLGGKDYLLVDGGSDGIIQNTANGTGLANNVGSYGILFGSGNSCGSNIEIRNLTVQNIYVRTAGTDEGAGASDSGGIYGVNCGSNISVHNNTSTYAHVNIILAPYGSQSNYSVYDNTTDNATWGINIQAGSTTSGVNGLYIYGNDVNDGTSWNDVNGTFHEDGIFVFGQTGGINFTNAYIYNNYLHGQWGGSTECPTCAPTGFIYLSDAGSNFYLFNNVFALTGAYAANGLISVGYGDSNFLIENNTFVGYSSSAGGIAIGDAGPNDTEITIENNIIDDMASAINVSHSGQSSVSLANYNDYFNVTGKGTAGAWCTTGCADSFSAWQGSPFKWDANGVFADPQLNSNYTLQSGSAAIGRGTNLYSTCNGQPNPGLGALCQGAPLTFGVSGSCGSGCLARAQSGAWDAVAYPFAANSPPPAPPTALSATVE